VDFCDQKIVENVELDYKQVIPGGLAKHFAAMSNRYGGLIIGGAGEDPQTGKPSRYDGVADDGKQIDRVHRLARGFGHDLHQAVAVHRRRGGDRSILRRSRQPGRKPLTLDRLLPCDRRTGPQETMK
jgi:hypothetical protein